MCLTACWHRWTSMLLVVVTFMGQLLNCWLCSRLEFALVLGCFQTWPGRPFGNPRPTFRGEPDTAFLTAEQLNTLHQT